MDGLPKDDLKWFGEGFDGFPKRLPEDCVEYCLFIIDKKLSQREILSRFTAVQKEASRLINTLLKGYIWQRDEFALKLELGGADGKHLFHQAFDSRLIICHRPEISTWSDELWRLGGRRMAHRISPEGTQWKIPGSMDQGGGHRWRVSAH